MRGDAFKTNGEKFSPLIESARKKLFEKRKERVRPHKDDKILTDWNGLMIVALAKAARTLGDGAYREAAEKCAGFILRAMTDADGRLLHRYRQGEAGITAQLDDYAFMTWALLELDETTFNVNYLEKAIRMQDETIDRFWDEDEGGFFFSADSASDLIVRRKEIYDGAVPSGNSVALSNLIRIARITGDARYDDKADRLVKAFSEVARRSPANFSFFLCGVDFAVGPSHELVIAGGTDGGAEDFLRALDGSFIPNKVVVMRGQKDDGKITRIAGFTKACAPVDGKPTAYVCTQHACKLPVTDPSKMLELLGGKRRGEKH